MWSIFFFQAEDGIRDGHVTGVQTCALPIFIPASLPVKLGLPFGAAGMMHETRAWIGTLGTADLSVGAAARALAEALARTERSEERRVGKECRSRGAP